MIQLNFLGKKVKDPHGTNDPREFRHLVDALNEQWGDTYLPAGVLEELHENKDDHQVAIKREQRNSFDETEKDSRSTS